METENRQKVTLDLRKTNLISYPQFIQGDTNIIDFEIKDNGSEADLSSVGKIVVNFKRSDRHVVSRLLELESETIRYKIGQEEMEKPGVGEIELQFFSQDNQKRISTLKFRVNIINSIGSAALQGQAEDVSLLQELFIETEEKGTYAQDQGDYAKQEGDKAKLESQNLSTLKTDVQSATTAANQAKTDANTAATNANAKATFAQTQGDHAKTQGDYAKREADRLVGTDVSVLDNKITNVSAQLAEKANQQIGKDWFLRGVGNIDPVNNYRRLKGIDAVDNVMYFTNRNTGATEVSYDNGATVETKTRPSGVSGNNVIKILRFKSHIYLVSPTDDTKVTTKIWRTPAPAKGVWNPVWEEVFTFQPNRWCMMSGINADSNYIYTCEYSLPDQPSHSVYRSADGVTWETVINNEPSPNVRHFHGINSDPFVPGSVWLTSGDGSATKFIWRSTNYGATWTVVGTLIVHQAVQISFDEKFVYFAGDGVNATLLVYNKAKNKLGLGSQNYHANIAVPAPTTVSDKFTGNAYVGCVDPSTGIYYCVANDLLDGNTTGLFYLPQVGGMVHLIQKGFDYTSEVYVHGSYVYCGLQRFRKLDPAW
jgi:hypothetical protein